jgi:hypothetical protein
VKNLTRAAGYGQWGMQSTNAIAVRQPCVHYYWKTNVTVQSRIVSGSGAQFPEISFIR